MKKFFLLTLIMSLALAVNAQQRTAEEAIEIAKDFAGSMFSKPNNRKTTKPQNLTISHVTRHNENVVYYIINNPEGGWVIVAGDEMAATDVLAYSDEGSFDFDNAAPGAKDMLRQYEKEFSFAVSDPSVIDHKRLAPAPRFAKNDVAPLIKSHWNQGGPYWNMCPKTKDGTCLTGCVATAMAQVMYFWKWPEKGSMSHTYYCGQISRWLTANFDEHTYDWKNMTNDYGGSSTKVQQDAVAQLMSDCGISVNMGYKPSSSGASQYDAYMALIHYFGYDFGAAFNKRENFSESGWANLLYNEISAGRPVLYTGVNDDSGHAFILDGYQKSSDKYHFNFGWGGGGDGYFALNYISDMRWDLYGNQAVTGIQPPTDTRTKQSFSPSQPYVIKHVPSGRYLSMTTLTSGHVSLRDAGTPVFLTDEHNGWYYINMQPECSGKYMGINQTYVNPTDDPAGLLFFETGNENCFNIYQMGDNTGYLGTNSTAKGMAVFCNKEESKKQEFQLVPYNEPLTFTYNVVVRCAEEIPAGAGIRYGGDVIGNNGTFSHTGTLTSADYEIQNVEGYDASAELHGVTVTVTYDRKGYDIVFDKKQTYVNDSRYINGLTLSCEGLKDQTLEVPYTSAAKSYAYQFLTLDDNNKVFTAYAGTTLTPTFQWIGTYMYGYVYLDEENDGSFAGNLVSKSNTSLSGDNGCLNKQPTLPAFKVPSKAGRYRMRFKVDWTNDDPAGCKGDNGDPVTGNNGIIKNGGSITDVILVVEEANLATITYNLQWNGVTQETQKHLCAVGDAYPQPELPGGLSYKKTGTVTTDETLDCNFTQDNFKLFTFSENFDNAIWYKIHMRNNNYAYYDSSNNTDQQTPATTSATSEYKFRWAVIGNPFGFRFVNMEAGKGKYLKHVDEKHNNFSSSGTQYVAADNSQVYDTDRKIYIKVKGSDNMFMNLNDGFYYWDSPKALGETGSALGFIKQDSGAKAMLQGLIDAAQALVNAASASGMKGNDPGQYSAESINTLKAEITAAKKLVSSSSTTEDQFNEELKTLQAKMDAFTVNMPEPGKCYIIQNGHYTTHYIHDQEATSASELLSDENYTETNRIWLYTDKGYLKNISSNRYMQNVSAEHTVAKRGIIGKAVTFKSLGERQFNIIPGGGSNYPLHDSEKEGLVGWFNEKPGEGSAWYLKEVADPTAINEVEAANAKANAVYDLSGRRVDGSYKGVVIINGRKEIRK